jgi:single-stranded-DNA-specific exonuclease
MQTNINTQNTDNQLHPVVLKILEKRGFNNENLNQYFSIDLKNIPDLTQLKDLDKASDRIVEAIEKNQKIGIFGDYDVDGTTSCAVFHHFFQMLGIEIELMQPSRVI